MGAGSSFLAPYRKPMELKIYADRCLTCGESPRTDVIHFMARKYGLKVNMRRVYVLPELRKELDAFPDVPMPFIALGNKTLDFYAVGEYLLKDEALENFINEVINEHTNEREH